MTKREAYDALDGMIIRSDKESRAFTRHSYSEIVEALETLNPLRAAAPQPYSNAVKAEIARLDRGIEEQKQNSMELCKMIMDLHANPAKLADFYAAIAKPGSLADAYVSAATK